MPRSSRHQPPSRQHASNARQLPRRPRAARCADGLRGDTNGSHRPPAQSAASGPVRFGGRRRRGSSSTQSPLDRGRGSSHGPPSPAATTAGAVAPHSRHQLQLQQRESVCGNAIRLVEALQPRPRERLRPPDQHPLTAPSCTSAPGPARAHSTMAAVMPNMSLRRWHSGAPGSADRRRRRPSPVPPACGRRSTISVSHQKRMHRARASAALQLAEGRRGVDRGDARAAVARARLPYRGVTPHPSLADTLKDLGDQAKQEACA